MILKQYLCLLLAFTLAPASINIVKHFIRCSIVPLLELHNAINGV